MRNALLCLTLFFAWAAALHAGHRCHHCGCNCEPEKTTRVVCEMKEVKTTKYRVKCEDYCHLGRETCDCNCNPTPTCGTPRVRRKLVKYEEVKKVPTYKCVVESVCPKCGETKVEEKEVPADKAPATKNDKPEK